MRRVFQELRVTVRNKGYLFVTKKHPDAPDAYLVLARSVVLIVGVSCACRASALKA